jgi:hypothetical protein
MSLRQYASIRAPLRRFESGFDELQHAMRNGQFYGRDHAEPVVMTPEDLVDLIEAARSRR